MNQGIPPQDYPAPIYPMVENVTYGELRSAIQMFAQFIMAQINSNVVYLVNANSAASWEGFC